jgi:hypothetical protein
MAFEQFCLNHKDKNAFNVCHHCKQYFCEECLIEGPAYYYCKNEECLDAFRLEASYHERPRFCPKCIADTTDESTGDIVSVNFIGNRLDWEGREECPTCKSQIVEKKSTFFGNKGSFRVIWLGDNKSTFISRKLKIVYDCDCGVPIRFPDLKQKIKVACPNCNKTLFFKRGKLMAK